MIHDNVENREAHAIGVERGRAAGSWLVDDGNARAVLEAIVDCDLDIPNPLSGEWAGESIPELSRALGLNLSDEWIADSFESGFYDGYVEQAELDARAYVKG